jgi:hypothetical protein
MVMGMLEAGGLEIVSDGVRVADQSNPRGYYEDERVKTLDKDTDKSWLADARGKAIKIISFLLKDLPDSNRYRVIFILRDMDEVLTSQRKMLQALGQESASAADGRIAVGYRTHLNAVNDLLSSRSCFDVVVLRYDAVVDRPMEHAERINQFVGGGLDVAKMAAVVDRALYRNRG